jgi:hypothetical protein
MKRNQTECSAWFFLLDQLGRLMFFYSTSISFYDRMEYSDVRGERSIVRIY